MAIIQALARLSSDDLKVEAGGTVEATVEVESAEEKPSESFQDYVLRVRGLPDGWYTLSTEQLRVEAGGRAEALLVVHPPHEDPASPLGEYLFTLEVVPVATLTPPSAPLSREAGRRSPAGEEGPGVRAPYPEGETIRLPGRLLTLAPGAATMQSRLLDYLPGVFRSDPFLARFLLIFQSIVDPIEQSIDSTHHLLDPGLTPARFLPWLASWVGIELDPSLDEASQRELIRRAVELSRWKGTRRALREELRIRTGGRALIVENFDGMRLGQDACLGLNTHLGVRRDHCIAVTLAAERGAAVDQRQADALIGELKPAHVGHVARIVPAPSRLRGGDHG